MDSIQYDDKNKFASLQCVWSKFLSFGSSFSSRRKLLLHTQTNKTENQNKASCICSVRWPSYRWVRLLSRANLFISSVIKKKIARTCIYAYACVYVYVPSSTVIPTTISNQCQFKFRLSFARWMKEDWFCDMKAKGKQTFA